MSTEDLVPRPRTWFDTPQGQEAVKVVAKQFADHIDNEVLEMFKKESKMEYAQREMPKYECHKKVWALKIKSITFIRVDGVRNGATIVPYEEGYASFDIDEAYLLKHAPFPDGYYVVYEDGYKSYSPAVAFESGYTRL